jgi:hypothetical protein
MAKYLPTWGLLLLTVSAARSEESSLTYERDIRPILKQHCFHCHGEEPKPKGKLDVRTVKEIVKGGSSGSAVVPGKPAESLLWERIESDEMPEGNKKVSPAQKALLKKWIEQGAKTARPEPDNPNDARFTEEELAHWAWQPIKIVPVPTGEGNPIDRFLLAKLSEKGVSQFSPETDQRTLIRRATFDLLGLPPTPEEVDLFLADRSPNAYERLLDRLLASPQYGERWGRHWLDVAGFAETDGNPVRDQDRPHAWRYRDYVIQSFNTDKRFNEFLREQIAGDEIAPKPLRLDDPKTVELLTATGFLRMAPDQTQTTNTIQERNQAVAEMMKVTSSTFLGLTVGCAQCHDHKYDPISAEDYYRLRAIFDPAFDLKKWKVPTQRLVDVTPKSVIERAEEIEQFAKEKEDALNREKEEAAQVVFDRELSRVPENDRAKAEAAIKTEEKKRSPEQIAILKQYPNVKTIAFIKGFFVEYDKKIHARIRQVEKEITELRATKPPRQFVMTVSETPNSLPSSQVHFRGDPEQPKQVVLPGELTVLDRDRKVTIPPKSADPNSSQRRLKYAEWLTSGRHPLTARVFVNRVWMHHFGKGLVATPGDFGFNGERPTHPELLDYLADDFVRHGWQVKRLHRQIMLTQAYRQSSRRNPELDRIDGENRLLGRMNLRRLEAESVRDALLKISGKLKLDLGGNSVPVAEDGEGKVVFGKRKLNEGLFAGIESIGDLAYRRSIYVESKRALPLAMLDTFDLPVMTPNCDARRFSTVAPQSLFLLNDQFTVEISDQVAERLFREATQTTDRVKLAYRLLFASEPTEAELKTCEKYLEAQTEFFKSNGDKNWLETVKKWPHAPSLRAMATLCQTLACSNRFLYVD